MEIHSPSPKRHHLLGTDSMDWLRTPPLSPVSSRAPTPSIDGAPVSRSPTQSLRKISLTKNIGSEMRKAQDEPSMGRRWIRFMHKQGNKEWVVPGIVAASTLVKYCIGLASYSGQATPPMFGDYEAQRHWMELTVHLPPSQWYKYDLQYWGLDYPPLTAYVSWLCGIIGSRISPQWFALDTSRGFENIESKLYMRLTVLFLDALLYVPALYMFSRVWQGTRSKRTQSLSFLVLILQPALLLIDFGHFQYNSVMLALTLFSINCFATNRDLLGAVCFTLSLGFKQMALYYAPAIGTYLVAKCLYLGTPKGFTHFVQLGHVTVGTLTLLFLPWLPIPPFSSFRASPPAILGPISRIFPFARGLFEDKVSNFWCFTNVLVKWKHLPWATTQRLVQLSTAMTALGFLPSVVILLVTAFKSRPLRSAVLDLPSSPAPSEKPSPDAVLSPSSSQASLPLNPSVSPTKQIHFPASVDHPPSSHHTSSPPPPFLPLLPYALLNSSLSFFLFSFQVHEKTILLPLMPITLLLSGASVESSIFGWGVLVNNAAVFSMWPLLKRDGLGLPYIALLILWNRLVGSNPFNLPQTSFIQLLSLAFYTLAFTFHGLEFLVSPPARYPDLFPVLNVLISTPIFGLVWLWSIKCCLEVSWAVGGLGKGGSMNVKATNHTHTSSGSSSRTRVHSKSRSRRSLSPLPIPIPDDTGNASLGLRHRSSIQPRRSGSSLNSTTTVPDVVDNTLS